MIQGVTLKDYTGKVWNLGQPTGRGALLVKGGITGLVGKRDDSLTTVPGYPGAYREGYTVPLMTGSLRLSIRGANQSERAEVYHEFREVFASLKPAKLLLDFGDSNVVWCDLVLDGAIDAPEERVEDAYFLQLSVPVKCFAGSWFQTVIKTGHLVTVTNFGDAVAYPRIKWEGASLEVSTPSGVTFTVNGGGDGVKTIYLDNSRSLAVFNSSGELVQDAWRDAINKAVAEGVPPGESVIYRISAGDNTPELQLDLPILDPFRKVVQKFD